MTSVAIADASCLIALHQITALDMSSLKKPGFSIVRQKLPEWFMCKNPVFDLSVNLCPARSYARNPHGSPATRLGHRATIATAAQC